jgi:hypothetical protein
MNDPYSNQFSKTDASAMSAMMKNGSLDFGDLNSKGGSSLGPPGGIISDGRSDKQKISSPRSPVGRTDKRTKEKVDLVTKENEQI